MKKNLQFHITSQKQAKRLLDVGLPRESADMIWRDMGHLHSIVGPYETFTIEEWEIHDHETKRDRREGYFQTAEPAWTIGRLMEIFDICYVGDNGWDEWPRTTEMTECAGSMLEYIVGTYERAAKENGFDFSKLNEYDFMKKVRCPKCGEVANLIGYRPNCTQVEYELYQCRNGHILKLELDKTEEEIQAL